MIFLNEEIVFCNQIETFKKLFQVTVIFETLNFKTCINS